PEALVLLLATASIGAVFSSCAPEFGTRSVTDRWRQIEPKVLVTVDGYGYGDKKIDRTGEVAAIRAALPSLAHVVWLPYLGAGIPAYPDLGALWRLAAASGTTYFGTSAPYLLACRKAGIVPRGVADLSRVRGVGSTGAPLPPEGFHWVYDTVGRHVLLTSLSGGTDMCTGFVGGVPLLPVYEGEITCRCLGARV